MDVDLTIGPTTSASHSNPPLPLSLPTPHNPYDHPQPLPLPLPNPNPNHLTSDPYTYTYYSPAQQHQFQPQPQYYDPYQQPTTDAAPAPSYYPQDPNWQYYYPQINALHQLPNLPAADVAEPSNWVQQYAAATPNATTTLPSQAIQLHGIGKGKRKKVSKKTKVVQSASCDICKVVCTSKDVLEQHKLGKKHLKNMSKMVNLEISLAVTSNPGPEKNPAKIKTDTARKSKRPASSPGDISLTVTSNPTIGPQQNPTKLKTDAARKSIKPTSSQGDISLVVTSKPTIGPQPNPAKMKPNTGRKSKRPASSQGDLESKRMKVVAEGASAAAVRVCTACNVVCNSQTVFNYHIAGQKHAASMKKYLASAAGKMIDS